MFNDVEGARIMWDRIVSDRHIVRVWALEADHGSDFFVTIEQYGSVWEDSELDGATTLFATADDDVAWDHFVRLADSIRTTVLAGGSVSFSQGAVVIDKYDVAVLDGKLSIARKALGGE